MLVLKSGSEGCYGIQDQGETGQWRLWECLIPVWRKGGGATRGTGGELTSGPIGQTEREAKVGEEWSSFIYLPIFSKKIIGAVFLRSDRNKQGSLSTSFIH